MPFLDVRVSRGGTPDSAAEIATELKRLTHELLGKKREVTAVAIDWLPTEQWFIGGESIAASNLRSFFLKIEITTGTNTKDQKAAFVAAAFAAMEKLLGPLAPASYVVIQEVPADAWGYAGRTQENRYIEGKRL
ncbi:MAG: tautomerase family protein [Gammaproteobacteria bacterium]|nr:tautomerase family protein [Gammaproteobacteria bacterium]MBU1416218.1 tautomerase family protein [Gammaproteobacteria bacterium]